MTQASQVLQLPPDALKQLPAGTPPPGVVSNFTNPEDKGYVLVTVATVFLVLGLFAFCIRAYGRVYVIKRVGWGDGKRTRPPFGYRSTADWFQALLTLGLVRSLSRSKRSVTDRLR